MELTQNFVTTLEALEMVVCICLLVLVLVGVYPSDHAKDVGNKLFIRPYALVLLEQGVALYEKFHKASPTTLTNSQLPGVPAPAGPTGVKEEKAATTS